MQMGNDMKVCGKMIYSMDKVQKHGMMDPDMMETMWKARNKEKEYTHGLMDPSMRVNGMTIKCVEWESIFRLMGECLGAIG